MEASNELHACRRFRRCREKLPLTDLLRDESGQLFCKPGMCPNGKNQNTTDLINLQVEIRKLRGEIKNNTSKYLYVVSEQTHMSIVNTVHF
jgi:hypothetical protein